MNNINELKPFPRFCCTIGAIPSSYIVSLSYEEQLLWLCDYIQYTLIPTLNENYNIVNDFQNNVIEFENNVTSQINELTNLYNKLKDYVDNYFNDINLQNEINNKLDEMAENGEFDLILSRIIPNNIMQYFDTLNDLKKAKLKEGQFATTLGYYEKFDGGNATYKIIKNETETIDNIFNYLLDNNNIASLINKNNFNILQIGAKRNDNTFDNKSIFQKLFTNGLNDLNIIIPNGTYYTSPINYAGNNIITKNIKVIGYGKPTIKLLHNNAIKTTVGTYNNNYYVSDNIGVLDFGNSCTISTIQLEDNKIYYYLKINDKSLIPESLSKNMVLQGQSSYTKAVISNIDKNDPDGDNTARIYLFETYNEVKRTTNFNNTNNTLNEILSIKEDLYKDYLYIRFGDNIIPSYVTVNSQFEQIDNNKTARVDKINISFENTNYIRLNCFEKQSIFDLPTLYLQNNIPFNINTFTGYSGGILSLNKMENIIFDNIIFDGDNLKVSNYQSNKNNWNIIISGGCKYINLNNCIFKNSIMAGIQIGGVANSNAPASHDYPENVVLTNCYFQNNGRGDIEVIYGHNITINNCVGDGTLDIETNGTEMLNNININNCQFHDCTPYSPSVVSGHTMINISNSKFFRLLAQAKVVLNLNNVITNNLEPQLCLIKGVNCYINQITGLNGNEQLDFTNTSFYGLYQQNPGGQLGNTSLHLTNCIIDLSLTDNNRFYNCKNINLNNCIIISKTSRKLISDNKNIYNVNNTTFKNVGINGVGANVDNLTPSVFKNCDFLSNDDTNIYAINGSINCYIENCYIESNITISYASLVMINNIISSITKPKFGCFNADVIISGLKTKDGSGINWAWVTTPASSHKVKFNDVEFNDTFISNSLGVTNGRTPVNTDSVSDSCKGYYVGNSNLAFCKLYYNESALAVKQISFPE